MSNIITIKDPNGNIVCSVENVDPIKSEEASAVLFGPKGRLGDKPFEDFKNICKKFSDAMKKFVDTNAELKSKKNFKIDKDAFSDTVSCAFGHFGVAEEYRDDPSAYMVDFHPFRINGNDVILGSGFPLEFYSYETDKKDDKIFPDIQIDGKYFTAFVSGDVEEKGLFKKTYTHKVGMALCLFGAAGLYK